MEQRSIPGREAGAVGLGCMGMTFAYDTAGRDAARDAASEAVIRRGLDLGVTLIDTADAYGPFTNEELVGRALAGRRDEAVITTKVGVVASADFAHGRNASPAHIAASIDGSLRRLGTDHVDLYLLHRIDPATPLEESWAAMAEVVRAGKARHIGISEATLAQVQACQAIHPVAAVQSELSLWTRDWLDDVVPWCQAQGAAFMAFSPLGRGYLTGTLSGRRFGDDDFRSVLPRFSPEAMAANEALVDVVRAVARRHGATPAQVALAWVLAQSPAVLPIPGTTKVSRLEENAAAAALRLDADDLAMLTALAAPEAPRY